VLRDSHEHLAVPGEPIVQRWQVSRDLFVVLEGVVEVRVDNAVVRMLGPGEFFGEVAALDWGAGYGRTRTATVSAVEETRLLVLDRQLVHDLVRSSPAVGDLLDDAAKSRLRPART
jgi:CRP-like cAMP-binding protein